MGRPVDALGGELDNWGGGGGCEGFTRRRLNGFLCDDVKLGSLNEFEEGEGLSVRREAGHAGKKAPP